MKKKYILLVPVGGLANRMKAIDSAVALRERTNSDLHIVWFRDSGLNCRFDQLFERIDIPGVTVTEATFPDLLRYDRPRRKNLFLPRLFQQWQFDSRIYEMQTLQLFYNNFDFYNWAANRNVYIAAFVYFYPAPKDWDCFSIFKPLPDLAQEIESRRAGFGTNTIGVHIRRTDNAISIAQSPTHLFINRMEKELEQNNDTTFYLATDSEEEKAFIIERFGEKILFSTQKADRNTPAGIQEALIELYLLSHTQQVLGSVHSSYSETAAQIGRIPYELLQNKPE